MLRRWLAMGAMGWVLLGALAARAEIKLPAILGDNMVLQRGQQVALWGWAKPGETITAVVGKATGRAAVAADGRWQLRLPAINEAGPVEVSLREGNGQPVVLKNVLVGEVWLCSGQSNMAWTVERAVNAEQEIATAKYPQIRLFSVKKVTAGEPKTDCEGQWTECSPETVKDFSAVGYFFARDLHQRLKMPVAVINSSWGGTPAEAWTSRPAMESVPVLKTAVEQWEKRIAAWPQDKDRQQKAYQQNLENWKKIAAAAKAKGEKPPRAPVAPSDPATQPGRPANLYNGMIAPLVPLALRGAIWYQGEANVSKAAEYRVLLATMINDWRRAWGNSFAFGIVQLAPYAYAFDPTWCAELREAQTHVARTVPNTGIAITMDIGDPKDIHPTNKQEVGRRLVLWALAQVYGQKLEFTGPCNPSQKIEGNRIRLSFQHGSGLKTSDGQPPRHFEIAASDLIFHPAQAAIDGDSVVVSCPQVEQPVAVRYAWTQDAETNLTNKEGLPAWPFKTGGGPWLTDSAGGVGSRQLDALLAKDGPLSKGERIAFLGDSITQGGAHPGGYVWLIEDALTRRRPDLEAAVIRAGISGHKVPNLQERLQRDVLSKNPTVVFIYIGINDVWHSLKGNGTSKEAYEAGLRDLLARIKQAHATAILAAPSVIGEKSDGSNPLDKMLEEYAAISRKVAKETGTPLCDLRSAFINYLKANNPKQAEKGILTGDGVHLNSVGNRLVAEQASAAIVAALKAKAAPATPAKPAAVGPARKTEPALKVAP